MPAEHASQAPRELNAAERIQQDIDTLARGREGKTVVAFSVTTNPRGEIIRYGILGSVSSRDELAARMEVHGGFHPLVTSLVQQGFILEEHTQVPYITETTLTGDETRETMVLDPTRIQGEDSCATVLHAAQRAYALQIYLSNRLYMLQSRRNGAEIAS